MAFARRWGVKIGVPKGRLSCGLAATVTAQLPSGDARPASIRRRPCRPRRAPPAPASPGDCLAPRRCSGAPHALRVARFLVRVHAAIDAMNGHGLRRAAQPIALRLVAEFCRSRQHPPEVARPSHDAEPGRAVRFAALDTLRRAGRRVSRDGQAPARPRQRRARAGVPDEEEWPLVGGNGARGGGAPADDAIRAGQLHAHAGAAVGLAERLTARAVREGRNIEALVTEILEAEARQR
jgi:hypothetical protein